MLQEIASPCIFINILFNALNRLDLSNIEVQLDSISTPVCCSISFGFWILLIFPSLMREDTTGFGQSST